MKYISTLDLRNKSSKLIQSLKDGESTYLIYRSKVVAEIKPVKYTESKKFNYAEFKKLISTMPKMDRITRKDREKIYRKHLEEKYGKDLS